MKKFFHTTLVLLALLPAASANAATGDLIIEGTKVVGIENGREFYGTVVIPDGVTTIGGSAFYWCSGIKSVIMPNSVTDIKDGAFMWCDGMESVVFSNNLTYIGEFAFAYCYSLSSIDLPSSLTFIGNCGFRDCAISDHVVLPPGITSIEYATFANNPYLPGITIPNSVTSIGEYVFYNCESLTEITIPSSVTRVLDGAFYNCLSLTDVYSYITAPTSWEAWDIFMLDEGDYTGRTLHVPAGTLALYQGSEMWAPYFGNIVEMGDGPTPGIPGDVDGDGKITIGDLADLTDYILGNADSSFIVANADVDGDGQIGIGDIAELIDILLNT